jgi:hypothetical protein
MRVSSKCAGRYRRWAGLRGRSVRGGHVFVLNGRGDATLGFSLSDAYRMAKISHVGSLRRSNGEIIAQMA